MLWPEMVSVDAVWSIGHGTRITSGSPQGVFFQATRNEREVSRMPLSGTAMLINFMNVDPEGEDDFNRWYDKEHLAERVAIPGFLEARRYVAESAPQRYLGIYTTETFQVLKTPVYEERLANPTPWSKRNLNRFRDATRACTRVKLTRGEGRGSALSFIRLRPTEPGNEELFEEIASRADAVLDLDGVLSIHLVASDPDLSVPLTESADAVAGASDWYVLIDATTQDAATAARNTLDPSNLTTVAQVVFEARYRLLWDLSGSELEDGTKGG